MATLGDNGESGVLAGNNISIDDRIGCYERAVKVGDALTFKTIKTTSPELSVKTGPCAKLPNKVLISECRSVTGCIIFSDYLRLCGSRNTDGRQGEI